MRTSTSCLARSGSSSKWLTASRSVAAWQLRPTHSGRYTEAGCENCLLGGSPRANSLETSIQRRWNSSSSPKPSEGPSNKNPASRESDLSPGRSIDGAFPTSTHSTDPKSRSNEKNFYGSYRRRASRGAPEEKVIIPDWFLSKNVTLSEDARHSNLRLEVLDTRSTPPPLTSTGNSQSQQQQERHNDGIYHIDKDIYDEINFMILGGMRASSTSATEDSLNFRSHLLLQSPQSGAEVFLNTVVAHAAEARHLDLLTIGPQDIADIAATIPEAFPERSLSSARRLGFDTYVYEDDHYSDTPEGSGVDQDGLEDALDTTEDNPKGSSFHIPSIGAGSIKPIQQMIQVWFPHRNAMQGNRSAVPKRASDAALPSFFTASNKADEIFISAEQDPGLIIRKFLDSHIIKRERQKLASIASNNASQSALVSMQQAETESNDFKSRGLIVHIKDYLELSATNIGGVILDKIHTVVDSKRREGRPVLIVGTSSSVDLVPTLSEAGFSAMQAGSDADKFRTIITTCKTPNVESIFVEDTKARTAQINCRNILAALREIHPNPSQLDESLLEANLGLRSEQMFQFDLAEEVWPLERVQRLTSIASGMLEPGAVITGNVLSLSLGLMDVSDKAKFAWVHKELRKSEAAPDQHAKLQERHDERKKALLKSCNRYEKKLMGGVIDAQKLKTTFDDVHVPPSTIEALKTLTTLSLIRPDAFKYGVLATDKIPGLLLYGPPGTGKTMLAKAVAKESGATVLEVAGSDVYDMYVGEGEKNIRAIFTLARKLSPCVVFIDEADAIFGSRSSSHNRKSHRELINQFLREWDGMNELSAFIMVATNRPFDLDDAVLRRLPRRLLVDLPSEKDREMILKIHLKDEILDQSVSLHQLASQTSYYSGSDLKNLSVAAALACVREENDQAAKHAGEEPYSYPEKRTLRIHHFEQAISEISASISEDMSSLSAIRKFDERYGDRGRRKRASGLGFGTNKKQDHEREKQEHGRVRKADVVYN